MTLAHHTAAYRDILAQHHEATARRLTLTDSARLWHLRRAKGLRERWGRVVQCGSGHEVIPQCAGCGTEDGKGAQPVTCHARECNDCRGRKLRRLRADLLDRCALAERERAAECARTHAHEGNPLGRWGWRHVVFTIPPGRGVAVDAAACRRALASVWRKYVTHCKREGREVRSPWMFSAVEATKGETRDGHIHIHALILGPYFSEALARRWWGEALASGRRCPTRTPAEVRAYVEAGAFGDIVAPLATMTRRGAAGREVDAVMWPVVDVKGVRGGLGAAVSEVAKYAVKDGWNEYTTDADTMALANLYCALARVRLYASSRWLAPHIPAPPPYREHDACEGCGTLGWWTPRIRGRSPPDGYRCAVVPGSAMAAPQ